MARPRRTEEVVRVAVYLPLTQAKALKHLAVDRDTDLSALVKEAIMAFLGREARRKRKPGAGARRLGRAEAIGKSSKRLRDVLQRVEIKNPQAYE